MKKVLFSILAINIFSVFVIKAQSDEKVKNIILMIGDGMGTASIYAGYTANKGSLNLERAEYIGFSKTSSADNYITDSGAGATAISTGHKTNNQYVGITPDFLPVKTILEIAEDSNLSTGMLATCEITHATPASFVAHVPSRYDTEAIAEQFVGSGVDVFIGGGRIHFEERIDGKNISDSLRSIGYSIVYHLDSIDRNDTNKIGCLVANNHPDRVLGGRGDFLVDATTIALSRLTENEKGFFLLAEGSQIDWAGHNNDILYQTSEMIDFDKAIGVAMDFADKNPGTLVVVTADHETGGLALTGGDIQSGIVEAAYSTNSHTGVMVPVFAYGTGAEEFTGIYENTELFHKMMRLYGFE